MKHVSFLIIRKRKLLKFSYSFKSLTIFFWCLFFFSFSFLLHWRIQWKWKIGNIFVVRFIRDHHRTWSRNIRQSHGSVAFTRATQCPIWQEKNRLIWLELNQSIFINTQMYKHQNIWKFWEFCFNRPTGRKLLITNSLRFGVSTFGRF